MVELYMYTVLCTVCNLIYILTATDYINVSACKCFLIYRQYPANVSMLYYKPGATISTYLPFNALTLYMFTFKIWVTAGYKLN